MKKMLMVASVPSMIGQFNINNIELLKAMGYQVDIACNMEDRSVWSTDRINEFAEQMHRLNVNCYQVDFSRKMKSVRLHKAAYKQLQKLIANNSYEFIHCHTPMGGAIARIAGHKNGTKVIYTAHGFHFYKGAPLINWLIFYPIEKALARYTDVLITINNEDYARAKASFKAKKIVYIPGVGIDSDSYQRNLEARKRVLEQLEIPTESHVLLSVGELNKNKNHKVIIRALQQLGDKNVYYLICGQGALQQELQDFIHQSHLENQVKLLGYQNEIAMYYSSADFFVFPSFREGLSVALMEAMAFGLPVVCSKIRGNCDLIEDGQGGFLVKPDDIEMFAQKIDLLNKDEQLREKMGETNLQKIKKFSNQYVQEYMKNIYNDMTFKSGNVKKPTILINYTGRRGGGNLDALEMAKALKEKGCTVVAVLSEYIENKEEWEQENFDRLVFIPTYTGIFSLITGALSFPLFVKRRIRKQLNDIEIDDIYCPMMALWSRKINRLFKDAKKIVVNHDPILHSGEKHLSIPFMLFGITKEYKECDALIVHSKKFVSIAESNFNKKGNTYYIPLGRHDTYLKYEIPKESSRYSAQNVNFLFFGRISKYKGLDVLADAFAKLEQNYQNVTLTVVGGGDFTPYQEKYNRLKKVTIENRFIDDSEVAAYFSGANLVSVLPYIDATQSGVLLVSQEFNVPVIATKTGGIVEQIEDQKTGILVEPNNSDELYLAMERFVNEPFLRETLNENVRESLQNMGWDKSAEELLKVIEKI